MRLGNITEVRQINDCKRSIFFNSFSSAKKFSKELLADGYEVTNIEIQVSLSQGGGKQPNMKVIGGNVVYVNFLYNAYEEHDKKLLLKLLKKYNKYIIH
jgi:hypothetical protein